MRIVTIPRLRLRTLLLIALAAMSAFLFFTWQAQPMPAVSNSIPTPNYVNDLYHFSASVPSALTSDYGPVSCQGSVFTLQEERFPYLKPLPRLTICYVRSESQNSYAFLKGELDHRTLVARNREWFDAREGVAQERFFGQQGTPGVEQYVVGKNQPQQGVDMRWYEAITQFEGRLYTIELVGPRAQWDEYWPYFKGVLDSLNFETGVLP